MPGTVRAAVSATDLLSLTQTCNQVSNGKYPTDEGAADTVPVCKLNGGFFWKADADIDCDGASSAHCSKKTDPWFAPETSFTGSNGKYPQAEFVPWVVIPIQDAKFNYEAQNIKPGALTIAVYNGKAVCGTFADENGEGLIGEMSYAMANALGINPDPKEGGVDSGVTYFVLTGTNAVVNPLESTSSAQALCNQLAPQLIANNTSTNGTTTASSSSEMRGLWIEDTEVVRTQADWNTLMSNAKSRGFTDVYANFTYTGGAYYQSSILPAWWVYTSGGDQLRLFINAAHANGLKAHNWVLAYNASYGTSDAVKTSLRSQGGMALLWEVASQSLKETANVWGATLTWLNYNSPGIQNRLYNIAIELANNYPDLDGIHFDYIRSPGDVSTFDQTSRQLFAQETGITISDTNWPYDVMQGSLITSGPRTGVTGAYRQQYLDWQKGNITKTLARIYQGVKTVRPSMVISAAVFPTNLTPELHHQDWGNWARQGIVDVLVPMDYTTNVSTFSSMVDQDLATASGTKPVYPGINFHDTNLTTANGLAMIDSTRQKNTKGFMFYRREDLSRSGLPSTFAPATTTPTATTTVFASTFEVAMNWTAVGDVTWYTGSPKADTHSVRLRTTGSIEKAISLSGYENLTVSFKMGANSLDNNNENLQALYYNGTSWVVLAQINNGSANENNKLNAYTVALPSSVNNLASFKLRFKLNGSGVQDYGYIDDVKVIGVTQ